MHASLLIIKNHRILTKHCLDHQCCDTFSPRAADNHVALPCYHSTDHMIMINRRVCKAARVHASERAVARLVFPILLTQFSGPAALSFSTDISYKLLGRQLWAVLSSEKSRSPATAIKVGKSRHNSRTTLRIKLLHVPDRDNIELYVLCKFQCSPCSVCCKTDVKDGKIAPQVLMPRGNIS